MTHFSWFSTLLCIALVTTTASAKNAKWFRYYENGVPQMTHTVTEKHIQLGYEELDASFRVINKVAPYSKTDSQAQREEAKSKKEAAEKAAQSKSKLLQTYGSSERAVRKRKEMLGDIQSKRGFAQQQLNVATTELNKELGRAGSLEKNGKTIPETLKKNIATKRAAVKAAQDSINDLMNNQMARVHDITQDIRRLRKIERTVQN